MENLEESKKSNFDGLSKEVNKIVTDPEIKGAFDSYEKKQNKLQILKFVGYVIAISSGIFGYMLKANSEADDRRAAAITAVINEKKEWSQKVNLGILELRKTRQLIKIDCDYNKPPSKYEQDFKRFLARNEFVKSSNGIDQVFNKDLLEVLRKLLKFDENVKDVCDEDAAPDEAWLAISQEANKLMRNSIELDKKTLNETHKGFINGFFGRI